MLRWLGNLMDRLCIVVIALLFLQLPSFMEQYTLQLQGHVAELHFQIQKMQSAAFQSGKNLSAFIEKFRSNSDVDFSRQGEIMHEMVARFSQLSFSLNALRESSPWTRWIVFIRYFDQEIAKETFATFHPGITFSYEALIYGCIGIFVGYILFFLLKQCLKRLFLTQSNCKEMKDGSN